MTDPRPADGLEELLEFLRVTRAIDFTGYKRPSLTRRVRKRMQAVKIDDFGDYRDLLEADPAELAKLVDTILINVTAFFRDEGAWDYLATSVVPAIIDSKGPDEPIRIWSAGCASGEEAYTLAMVFAEQLGVDEFKARVKIFATDTDDGALARGRAAIYPASRLESIPAELRARYFEPLATGFRFHSDCRRSVIFGRHDITSDAPISRLDLLVCRNVLMYFVAETQRRVLGRFHYALRPGGYLFLGKAETIFAHHDLFASVDVAQRVFRRTDQSGVRSEHLGGTEVALEPTLTSSQHLSDMASAATPVAQLVVDVDGLLVAANTKARAMFGLTRDDLQRPFSELTVSYRPIELRSRIEQAYVERQPIVVRDVSRPLPDDTVQFLEVTVAPLIDPSGIDLGVAITFADVTEIGRIKAELERSTDELRSAYDDLATANVRLETSNEELQSTNEELETTNEELQSANEELETMNEELQSANEELETMNEELILQSSEIERGEQFLTSILDGLTLGLVVLSDDLDVAIWNQGAVELFGLRGDEAIGRPLAALDLPNLFDELAPKLASVAADASPASATIEITDRRGRRTICTVAIHRLVASPGDQSGEHRLLLIFDHAAGSSAGAALTGPR